MALSLRHINRTKSLPILRRRYLTDEFVKLRGSTRRAPNECNLPVIQGAAPRSALLNSSKCFAQANRMGRRALAHRLERSNKSTKGDF